MPDSESEPDNPHVRRQSTSEAGPFVPQITLTEAVDENPQDSSLQLSLPSPGSLSPTAHRDLNRPSTPTLPLTRDILTRKNKLDKLLHNAAARSRRPPAMIYSLDNDSTLDERITAGLGITPPATTAAAIENDADRSSYLRHRRRATQTSNYFDESKTPRSSGSYRWEYDFDLKQSFGPTSINENMMAYSNMSSAATTTSKRNSIARSPKGYLKGTIESSPPTRYPPPPHPPHIYSSFNNYRSHHAGRNQFSLLDMFMNAAARVVNLRGPEKAGSMIEHQEQLKRKSLHSKKRKHRQSDQIYDVEQNKRFSGYSASLEKHSTRNYMPASPINGSISIPDHRSIYTEHFALSSSHASVKSVPPPTPTHPPPHPPLAASPSPSPPSAPYFPHQHQLHLRGRSLCIFPPKSRIRQYIWEHVLQWRYAELFLLFLILLQYFLLICVPIYENAQKTQFGGQWTHYVILCIQIVYTLEAICKIIAYGLFFPPNIRIGPSTSNGIKSWLFQRWNPAPPARELDTDTQAVFHTAYLNGFANAIDFISIISYWIDVGLMVHGYPNCSLFKALGAARPLRLLSLFPGTATILRSLQVSWDMLKDVIGFIFFFLLLFALVGLISFQGAFSRRCYAVADDGELTLIDPPLHCAGYYNGSTLNGAYNPITDAYSYPGRAGYYCSNGQVCLELDNHNPNYGFVNFDTIYYAILNVYTFVSLELWTEIMYRNMDGDSTVSALYYCLGVYVISFILIFLIFAVITSGFSRVRAESKVSAFTGKKKQARLLRPVQVDEANDEYIWKFEDADRDHNATSIRLKRAMVKVVKSRAFFYFGGFMVLLDTIFMSLRSVHASEYTLEMIDNVETAFTFFFALEILVRMAGATTWMQFWNSGRNKFDLLLVIATCIIQLPMIQDSPAYKYLTIFQCLRMYRLFICIPRVRRLLSAALGTGESVVNVVGFLLLATALCAPIFMELFGGDFGFIEPDDTELRCDTFWQSFLTLIMLYTSETWTEFLYNAMESQPGFSAVYAAIFTSVYLAFGRYIMSGLYIAVILENFELEDEEIKQYQIRQFIHKRVPKTTNRLQTLFDRIFRPLLSYSNKKQLQIRYLPSSLTAHIPKPWLADLMGDGYSQEIPLEQEEKETKTESKIFKWFQKSRLPWKKQRQESNAQSFSVSLSGETLVEDMADDYDLVVAEENRRAGDYHVQVTKSLLFFSSHNKFRRWCKRLVGSSSNGRAERRNLFNWFIMLCVLMSILIVILDEPSTRRMRQDTELESSARTLDIALSIVFLVEISIRIIADGLVVPPGAYLRNSWNRLDFVVVILNFITLFTGNGDLPRALGTVRSLRILRLIRYFSGMRDVFVDLFHAFPLMLDALLLVFLVMVFFSVYGVNILGGRMVSCNDDSVAGRSSCIGEFQLDVGTDKEVRIYQPRVWAIPDGGLYSYDDFPAALAQLFSLSSTEGWVDSLFYAMSAPPEPDLQPTFNWDSEAVFVSIFYVIFMVISHGTLQLFVGVIIEKFKQRAGISTMTIAQRQYADLRRQLAELKPTPRPERPTSKIGQICYDLVANKRGPFNKIMMWVIILNICVIASEFQNEPSWLQDFQDFTYLAFIIVYVVEVIVKYIGLGWVKWSRSKWNWYDAFIACSALILAILRFAVPDLWTLRIERYCLIFAAFRLGEGIDSLQTLYHTVRMSLPKIVRVTAVFLLVMCLFAMVFMELFGLTKYGEETGNHSNFRDYGNALLLLIRVTTGEAWNVIMMDYTVQAPKCVASDNYLLTDCGSPGWAYFMFNFFYLICTHIFLNLFTATVVSNFEYAYETRSRFTRLTKDDLRNFKYAWREVDPSGSGYIQRKDVIKFLSLLKGRLQVRIYDEDYSVNNLKKLLRKTASPTTSPRLDEKLSSMLAGPHLPIYDVDDLCRRLSRLDEEEIQERRRDFNMCYLEIVSMETSKGISFDDVRTILSYRFFNVEEALHIDALIQRLEKLDQLQKMYASEKAMGVFLTMAQRKRYLHQLWQKKNEEEASKLVVPSTRVGLKVDTSVGGLHPLSAAGQYSPSATNKQRSQVPTIVIQDAPPSPHYLGDNPPSPAVPISPLSNFSFDTQLGSPGAVDSLSTTAGSNHAQASPYPGTITDSEEFYIPGSPSSPSMLYSPASPGQRWRLIDSNTQMTPEVAGNLMDTIRQSPWSDLLHEESSR